MLGVPAAAAPGPQLLHLPVDLLQTGNSHLPPHSLKKGYQHIPHHPRVVRRPVVVEGGQIQMLRHDVQLILAQAWQQILRQNERINIGRLERNAALPAARADKADIKFRVVCRKRRVTRESEERRQRVLELWRAAQHLVRDTGQTDNLRR